MADLEYTTEDKCYGQIGYEAYVQSTGGKTFDGRDMPKWEGLPPNIQKAWTDGTWEVIETFAKDNGCERFL